MKKWEYVMFIIVTLILIAPYLWLILNIIDRVDYEKILLNACLAGPCLLASEAVWVFVGRLKKYNLKSDEE